MFEFPLDGIMWADLDLNFFNVFMLSWSLWLSVTGHFSTFVTQRFAYQVPVFLNRGPVVLVGIAALKSDENLRKNLRMGSYLGVERPVWADFGGKVQLKYMCFSVLRECRRIF